MQDSAFFKKLFSLSLLLNLMSCAVGPDFEQPAPPEVEAYTENSLPMTTVSTPHIQGGEVQTLTVGQDIPAKWWELFRSPELNAMIEQGIANNPSLQAAQATLREAEENLIALMGSTMLPAVTGAFSKQRLQYPPFGTTSGITGIPSTSPINSLLSQQQPPFNLYNASVNVSYTLDVFGGNRRSIEALLAQVNYQRYELEGTYLTLTANIVTTAITEASLRAQIKATKDILKEEQKGLDITSKQFKLGGKSKISVLAQKAQLEQTRATLPVLEKNLADARSALAVLVGDFPGNKGRPTFHLENLHLPTELPISVPSDLVQQRPDIQASEALLHAATAQIGVATANLLPKFTITGAYGTETGNYNNLFGPGSSIWNWQGQVMQTIFNGGALIAQRKAAIAAFDASYAQYQLAVLTAFQNVSDALNALESDAYALQSTTAAEEAAKGTVDLVQQQYLLGGASYLDVIIALNQYHQAYISRVIAQATRYSDTAALFQAMGGGWWNRQYVTDDFDIENKIAEAIVATNN